MEQPGRRPSTSPGSGGPASGTNDWGAGRLPSELDRRYVIVEELSERGGEAQVFRVRAAGEGNTLVLKLYDRGLGPEEGVWEFLDDRPDKHLIRLHDHGWAAGRRYEVMEDAAGGDVRALLRQSPHGAAPAVIREIVDQVGAVLSAAHQRNIVHHDLKPENLLLRSAWRGDVSELDIAVTDFGVSRIVEQGAHFSSRIRGTSNYFSPEYLNSDRVSPAMDYWALGITVVELLLGRNPIDLMLGDAPNNLAPHRHEQIISYTINAEPMDLSAVLDPRMQLLCMGLLTRNDRDRWTYEQIRKWRAGDSPEHHFTDRRADAPPPAPPRDWTPPVEAAAIRPYTIFGSFFHDPRSLAIALGGRWDDAARRLFAGDGQKWRDLIQWLPQFDSDDEDAARRRENLIREIDPATGVAPEGVRLFRLIRFLDPASPVVYGDYRLDPGTLRDMATDVLSGDRTAVDALHEMWGYGLLTLSGRRTLAEIDTRWHEQEGQWQATVRAIRTHYPRLEPDIEAWNEEQVQAGLLLVALGDNTRLRRWTGIRLEAGVPWYADLTDPRTDQHGLLAALLLRSRAIEDARQAMDMARDARASEISGYAQRRMAGLFRLLGRPVAIGWAAAGVALLAVAWVIVITVADALPFVSDRAVIQSWVWVICCLLVVAIGEGLLAARIIRDYPNTYSMLSQFVEHGAVVARPIRAHGLRGVIGGLVVLAALVASVAYLPLVLPVVSAVAHAAWAVSRARAWQAAQRGTPRWADLAAGPGREVREEPVLGGPPTAPAA